MNRPILKWFLLVFLGGLLVGPLQAEVVFLRNGQSFEGRIVRQTPVSIEVTTPKGNRSLQKKEILRIQYVSQTREQKRQQEELLRKAELARQAERERIEREKLAGAEKARRLKELEDRVVEEKRKEAKDRAERAAALRDLVDKGQMEKPADEPISYMDFAWRSVLVPGWGHFTLNRPVTGTIYMVSWAAVLGNAASRRGIAVQATSENHRQVLLNTFLYTQPQIGTPSVRSLLAQSANASALTAYQKKIDNYNYSLYLVGAFYGAQLLHIIYNGIAWENGLLIVDGTAPVPKEDELKPTFALGPDVGADGRLAHGGTAQFGLTYTF